MTNSPKRTSGGAAAVEFALVLPLLLLLVLGGIDWGYYFYVTQVITNAAREGARAGSLEATDDGAAVTVAENRVIEYLDAVGIGTGDAGVSVSLPGNAVQVVITYPAGSITGFAQVIIPEQTTATAEMRRF